MCGVTIEIVCNCMFISDLYMCISILMYTVYFVILYQYSVIVSESAC